MRVDFSKAAQVVNLLCEGVGIRAASRLTGLEEETVLNILETAGKHCEALLNTKLRNLKVNFVEIDELWAFVRCKQVNAREFSDDGDQYTFLATDSDTKLIISQAVAKRTKENAFWFIRDLQTRIDGRCQISTDGFDGYTGKGRFPGAIERNFGKDGVDYGTEIKMYESYAEGQRRYSAPVCIGAHRRRRLGNPDRNRINTSHAERTNLSVRIFNRRFTRLTLGYSKKLENHRHAVALFTAHFNFCRVHSAHKQTPAQAAGLTDRVWTVGKLLSKT